MLSHSAVPIHPMGENKSLLTNSKIPKEWVKSDDYACKSMKIMRELPYFLSDVMVFKNYHSLMRLAT